MQYLADIGGSALTDASIPVPDANLDIHEVPITYVPFRNAHLLCLATSWAEVIGAEAIYIGVVEEVSSGYPDCTETFCTTFAQAIQADLKAVGIEAEIVTYEWGTYLDKVQRGQHDMALLGWTGDNGDPDNFLYVLLDKSATQMPANNIAFYRSEPLHKVLIDAQLSSDQDERTALYRQAQEIVFHDAPWVPLVHAAQSAAFNKKVQGFQLHPTGSKWFHGVEIKE